MLLSLCDRWREYPQNLVAPTASRISLQRSREELDRNEAELFNADNIGVFFLEARDGRQGKQSNSYLGLQVTYGRKPWLTPQPN